MASKEQKLPAQRMEHATTKLQDAMNDHPSWNTDFSLPKRALFVSTPSFPAFVEETEALLDELRKEKRTRFSGNSHQRRVQRRKVPR